MSIEVLNVNKNFGTFKALSDVNLKVESGELIALLGPSGCGKTTLLRIIAGLEYADEGAIHFLGEDITQVHVRDRNVGFMFQHYALFRHMSVFENVAFGLRVRPRKTRPTEAQIREKVMALLALVQLEHLHNRHPSQLSGGQRQRVALARALAVEPKVLLLDEPFGALDAKVRKELRRWLRRLHEELHITTIFVTHDQEEALEVADRVVLMQNGCIEQVGAPELVWAQPANPFVYEFLGDVNLFEGYAHAGKANFGDWVLDAPAYPQAEPIKVRAYVRPHEFELAHYVAGAAGKRVKLCRVMVVGATAQMELIASNDSNAVNHKILKPPLELLISAQQYQEMKLQVGDELLITPCNARIFTEGN